MGILDDIKQSIIEMKRDRARELTQQALDEGLDADKILHESLIPAMDTVGKEYEEGVKFIPEILIASKAMLGVLDLLKPILASAGAKSEGKVVLGTVEGDVHDIGINLVGMMMEGAGFEVHDIGVDQSVEKFMAAAEKCKPDIIGMSALLTTTMTYMKTVIDGFDGAGQGHIKMAVGGAPISQMFADEIGADGYGSDASSAVDLFLKMTEKAG